MQRLIVRSAPVAEDPGLDKEAASIAAYAAARADCERCAAEALDALVAGGQTTMEAAHVVIGDPRFWSNEGGNPVAECQGHIDY